MTYGVPGFDILNTTRVLLQDVSLYSLPGMGLHSLGSKDLSYTLGVRRRPIANECDR